MRIILMSGRFAYLHKCLLVCLYLTIADRFLFGFLENTGELNLDIFYTNLAGPSKINISGLPFRYHRFQMAIICHCHIVLDNYVINNWIVIFLIIIY